MKGAMKDGNDSASKTNILNIVKYTLACKNETKLSILKINIDYVKKSHIGHQNSSF